MSLRCPVKVRRWARPVLAVLVIGLPAAGAVPAAGAAPPAPPVPAVVDLTATPAGRAAAATAAFRATILGVPTAAEQLEVAALPDGSLLVGPDLDRVTVEGDTVEWRVGDANAAEPAAGDDMAASAGWELRYSQCLSRKTAEGVWLDQCYKLHRLSGDGSTTYDYRQLEHYGTTDSSGFVEHVAIYVDARLTGMSWFDWSPDGDITGGCAPYTVQITWIVSISHTVTRCREWNITKYADPGDFRLDFWCRPPFLDNDCDRAYGLSYMTGVRVRQNGEPIYSLGWVLDGPD